MEKKSNENWAWHGRRVAYISIATFAGCGGGKSKGEMVVYGNVINDENRRVKSESCCNLILSPDFQFRPLFFFFFFFSSFHAQLSFNESKDQAST